jgi:parvulin-like peptidyl-prolyl isomerase
MVQYIFLDNNKLRIDQIDSLKKIIFGKLENGETFGTLARQYSMDGNSKKNGDLGWFEEGQMMKEFEDKVKSRQSGEVYTVDMSDKKWYYVVKNTHQPRTDRKVVVLYLEINIRP